MSFLSPIFRRKSTPALTTGRVLTAQQLGDHVGFPVVLKNGNVNMTEQQWNDWAAGLGPDGDDEYQLNCISANLGLTRA